MPEIPAQFLVHSVSVESKTGEGSRGAIYGTPATIRCFRDESIRKVLDAAGDEVVSSATLYAPLAADLVPVGSRVTWPNHSTYIIAKARRDDAGVMGAWQHVEISCA
jgi:hypothetical protein